MDMWTSSKTMDTNRCGKTVAFPAIASVLEEYPSEVAGAATAEAVRASGVSMLNEEIV